MTDILLVQHTGPVAILTLNRPERFNAFDDALIQTVHRALDDIEGNPGVRALVLTGAGRAFSSGADLSGPGAEGNGRDYGGTLNLPADQRAAELQSIGGATRDGLLHGFNPLVQRLHEFDKAIVCAVNGTAAGGGVGIALACDIVIAAASAQFVQVFAPKLGLVPDCGLTWQLPRTVGLAHSRALAMLGDSLPAREAERLGLIWKTVEDASLQTTALEVAQRLAANPAHVNGLIKQAFRAAQSNSLAEQLALEARMQADCGAMPSFIEGVMAFQQKRSPVFYPEDPGTH